MKSINISDGLHKELKLYALKHNDTIKNIVDRAIRNVISQKPSELKITHEPIEVKKGDVPFT